MKLCSECQFIYEDEQERCDMDGAELVYEPTLEHVFPNSALQTRIDLERSRPARLVSPLSRLSRPLQTSPAQPGTNRSRLTLQIAAVAVLAALSFAAFYATPRVLQTKPETAKSAIETQQPKLQATSPFPVAPDVAATAEKPETKEMKPEASSAANKLETRNSKRETVSPVLSELKPLPRLKPLPTLKPIPKLSDRSRSENANRKTIIVNTNTKKDSRFGSFLKKTGRILTKPFNR
jgi:hypothetical protein